MTNCQRNDHLAIWPDPCFSSATQGQGFCLRSTASELGGANQATLLRTAVTSNKIRKWVPNASDGAWLFPILEGGA